MRIGSLGRLLVVVSVLFAFGWQGGSSGAPQATSKPYDIIVMVVANAPGPAQVVVSYAQVVDHATVRAGIRELAKRVRFTPSKVVIRDAPLAKDLATKATDAEFLAPELVGKSGHLPVGPIIRSLPLWGHMRLVFVLDPEYPFSGPDSATADGFAVRLVNTITTYEYDVERISERTVSAGDASAQQVGGRGRSQAAGIQAGLGSVTRSFSRQALLAVLIGMPSGLLTGWLLYGWRERTKRARWAPRPGAGRTRRRPASGGPDQGGHGT